MTNYRLTPLRDTTKNKERIIKNTRRNMEQSKVETPLNRPIVPFLITACVLLLSLFLVGPYMYQAFFKEQNFTIEKVVFPESAHDSLYNAIYIDETNEFIYSKQDGFYAFDVASKQETLLIEGSDINYGYLASEKWVVWRQVVNDEPVVAIWNRQTDELKTIQSEIILMFELQGDTMLALAMREDEKQQVASNYLMFDLNTEQVRVILESTAGSNSKPAIEGNLVVISQTIESEIGNQTIISVHDTETMDDVATFSVPYDVVQRLTIKDGIVYGYMWKSSGDEQGVVGAIDMAKAQFTILETSVGIEDYATDGQHFALAITKGDSNSVQLFEKQDERLKRISALVTIRERLVLPRFTEQGTLVVTSEGPERPMYLIRFK